MYSAARSKPARRFRSRRPIGTIEPLEPRQLLAADPVISELVADTRESLLDGDGNRSDWIEIHNAGDEAINLQGWHLTDDPADLTKWTFPSKPLGADEYLVVFASDPGSDNYVDSAGNLHTNFALSADGEYLALVRPDLTVASEFAPAFPPQLEDVSYGLQVDSDLTEELVAIGASGKYLVPTSTVANWQSPGFSDSSWAAASTGVGFDAHQASTPPSLVRHFPFDETGASTTTLEAVSGVPQAISGAALFSEGRVGNSIRFSGAGGIDMPQGPSGMRDGFTISTWVRPDSASNTLLAWHDNTLTKGFWLGYLNGGPWLSFSAGANAAAGSTGSLANVNAPGTMPTLGQWYHLAVTFDPDDTSQEIRFYLDGAELTEVSNANVSDGHMGDPTGQLFRIGRHNLGSIPLNGSLDDLAVFDEPLSSTAIADIYSSGVTGVGGPKYNDAIATNLESDMLDQNATAYLRIPFSVDDASQFNQLVLDVQYDDGFVAYLNGTVVAQRNAPANPTWNSTATSSRDAEEPLNFESIDISQHVGLLVDGQANVLAIQLLNASADDPDLLMTPRLTADRVGLVHRYFTQTTPGAPNADGFEGFVEDTRFSMDRGFYNAPFSVEITTPTPNTFIRYTTDGSEPTADHGQVYSGPILIDRQTTLRAAGFRQGFIPTNVDTHTYLFVDDVLNQPALPPNYPSTWNHYAIGPVGTPVPADYEMDPRIVNDPAYSSDIVSGLLEIPTLSLVMAEEDWFDADQGIYVNPFGFGDDWEREVSAEWIDAQGGDEFQLNAGIRVFGGYSRHFWATPKKSFTLRFRNDYGSPRLDFPLFEDSPVDSFDLITLRAVFSDAWPDAASPPQYLRDFFARQTQLDMGNPSSRGNWVHLYINGLYWGIYNPSERPDADFAASHFGGEPEEYDAIKHGGLLGPGQVQNNTWEVIDGDDAAWREVLALARAGLGDADRYRQFQQLVDVENLADYIILNTYLSNVDWPHKNWWSNRKRDETGRFRFYAWDSEYTLNDVNVNRLGVNNTNTPAELYAAARVNPDFRLLFADRVHKHLFNDGALQPAANIARYEAMADVIENAVIAESARWGDNAATRQGPTFYTKNGTWLPVKAGIVDPINGYFARRHAIVLNQYRNAGLYTAVVPPSFNQHGGTILPGFALTMDAPAGTIYYTLDGSDPRQGESTVTSTTLLEAGAPVRALVPTSDMGTAWRTFAFNDSSWLSGTTGVGYDNDTDYDPLIGLDIQPQLNPDGTGNNEYNSVYMRMAFDVTDPNAFNVLNLEMRYDDGFVAYLNGVEVARANAPANPLWNSAATADHPDTSASAFQTFNISDHLDLLQPGENVLAVHGMNTSGSSSDMLITPRVVAGIVTGAGISPSAVAYDGSVSLTQSTTVKARVLQGNTWSALNEASFLIDEPTPLRITEVMYNPAGSDDTEYIELKNTGSAPISLAGITISDGVDFQFPDMQLAPQQHVLVVANQAVFAAKYDTTGMMIAGEFVDTGLNNAGERLALTDRFGRELFSFSYSDGWYPITDGMGFSLNLVDDQTDLRDLDEVIRWKPSSTVDGSPGSDDASTNLPPASIVVNEINTNSANPADSWIELHNTTASPIDVSGWYLSDDPEFPRKRQLAVGTVIGPQGYLVVSDTSMLLSPDGGSVVLTGGVPDGTDTLIGYQLVQDYAALDTAVTIGRTIASDGDVDFVALSTATPGNGNSVPIVGPVVINELHYHPVDGGLEFVELHNISDQPVALNDLASGGTAWYFGDGVEYEFPAGTVLPPGGYLIVTGVQPEAFRAAYGLSPDAIVLGSYQGMLNNDGEAVELYRTSRLNASAGILVDRVRFNDAAPWPLEADGEGPSLERVDSTAYGNDPANWMRGVFGGSPNAVNVGADASPPSAPGDVRAVLDGADRVTLHWTPAVDLQSGVAQYRVLRNGQVIDSLNATTSSFVDDDYPAGELLDYRVVAVNGEGIAGPASSPAYVAQFQNGVSPTATYQGVDDTLLSEQHPTVAGGAMTTLLVDADEPDESGLHSMVLARWDISSLPADAVIESIRLQLNATSATGDTFELYEMRRPWIESQATWNQYAAGSPWQAPGASGALDRGTAVLGQVGPVGGGSTAIELNDAGRALVQAWRDGTTPNYGFVLVPSESSGGGSGDPTVLANLIAFYDFNEIVGGQALDLSGNGNHATVTNVSHRSDGFNGGAYEFNGSGHVVAPVNINPTTRPQLTMGAWVHASAVGAGLYKILGHDNGNWDRTIGLDNRGSGGFRWTAFVGNGNPVANTPSPAFDQWTFIAATYDQTANTMTLYVDLDANSTSDAPQAFTTATGFGTGFSTVAIGNIRPDNFSEAFLGLMDNVFFFDTALTANQIRQVRDGGAGYFLAGGLEFDSSEATTVDNRPQLVASFVPRLFGDLTGDQQVDHEDIDALHAALRNGTAGVLHDLDGSGVANHEDRDYLVRHLLATELADANLDGYVDGRDFNRWNAHKFISGVYSWSDGDFNGDGTVDGSDFNIWFSHRFSGPATSAAARGAVPRAAGHVVGAVSVPAHGSEPAAGHTAPDSHWDMSFPKTLNSAMCGMTSGTTHAARDLVFHPSGHFETSAIMVTGDTLNPIRRAAILLDRTPQQRAVWQSLVRRNGEGFSAVADALFAQEAWK